MYYYIVSCFCFFTFMTVFFLIMHYFLYLVSNTQLMFVIYTKQRTEYKATYSYLEQCAISEQITMTLQSTNWWYTIVCFIANIEI